LRLKNKKVLGAECWVLSIIRDGEKRKRCPLLATGCWLWVPDSWVLDPSFLLCDPFGFGEREFFFRGVCFEDG
jgi:hypothetical protein